MTSSHYSSHSEQPHSKNRLRLWLKLLKTSNQIESELRRRLRKEYNSTLPRFDVMSALSRAPEGMKMGEISAYLRVSAGNITVIIDKLTEEGLAVRSQIARDRRANLVQLTPKGIEDFAEHAAAHEAWIDELLGNVGPEKIKELLYDLDALTPFER